MAKHPLFSSFLSVLGLLLLHFGCFISSSASHRRRREHHRTTAGAVSVSWFFIKRLFRCVLPPQAPNLSSRPSPCSSSGLLAKPIFTPLASPEKLISGRPAFDTPSGQPNIYPCSLCGEIFLVAGLLEKHQFVKHAIWELEGRDSGHNVVRIIFKTGWPAIAKNPVVHRILKIHNSPKILARFEEYREFVKSKAAREVAGRRRDARCIADGNELLRFHCSTFLCDLNRGVSGGGACSYQFCSACGIIRSGFSAKMDGISTQSSGWKAHRAVPEEIEEEFQFMRVKRAMLVCRVIAGRVGGDPDVVEKEGPGFDSLVGRGNGVCPRLNDEDELWVYNPRAVLPCFVIVYTV
ncbi:unnamed protein product [Cuscuta epithymum]|uniref:C2H2-type domain-containing protein n=1 Tax=Cuscuta epithymum TaxID=186058 RepID=A0AAV0CDS1_9ASTE|nr:unnamed protein product [Cuscuta epithymum]